ncbi:MAG: methyltransferase domain-containing protein [bacterium]|nr:methyltransferase domain-containing protein [bacterium]
MVCMNRWDERYAADRYFYGTEPNELVRAALAGLPTGRALFLAEGEGRNAVHAAALGHEVVAVDSSTEGRRKALALAAERGVALTYLLGDVATTAWDDAPYDLAVLCFFHAAPAERARLHARTAAALRPGGRLSWWSRSPRSSSAAAPADPRTSRCCRISTRCAGNSRAWSGSGPSGWRSSSAKAPATTGRRR